MGVHRLASNRKSTIQRKHNQRTHRRKLKVAREKRGGVLVGDIADPELMTAHMLSKRRTSPRANITLSGKKKRKLIKQLKHMAADKEKKQAAEEEVEMAPAPKEKKSKDKKSESQSQEDKTVEEAMDDDEWEDEEEEEVIGDAT